VLIDQRLDLLYSKL